MLGRSPRSGPPSPRARARSLRVIRANATESGVPTRARDVLRARERCVPILSALSTLRPPSCSPSPRSPSSGARARCPSRSTNQVDEYFPDPERVAGPEAPGAEEAEATAAEAIPEQPDLAGGEEPATTEPGTEAEAMAETGAPVIPEPAEVAAEAHREVRREAERCAERLNGHRESAEIVSIIQAIISGVGGVTGGVGGALAAVDFGNPDITTAMGVMSSIGGGITVVGNMILGFLANPLEELRQHSLGQRSWEIAVELQYGGAEPEAVMSMLRRCAEDQPPPVRVAGQGEAFDSGE